MVAESDGRGMRPLATALLAAAEGVGPLLLQHPRAVAAVLARLEAAAAEAEEGQPAKRARTEAQPAGEASAAERQAGEEVEAAWALCSALARALAPPPAPAGEGDGTAGAEGAALADAGSEAALAVLAEHAGLLSRDWGADGGSLAAHQAYVVARVLPLLAGRLDEGAAAELAVAAERARAAAAGQE